MPSKSTLKRKPGETKSEYIQRLMSNKTMLREYPRRDQRYAVANSYWRQYGASRKSKKSYRKSKKS